MTDTTQDTMRTRILDAIQSQFPQRDHPDAPDFEEQYGVSFSVVTRDPVGQVPIGKISVLGIYGGGMDRLEGSFPFVEARLPVTLEIHAAKEEGVELARTMERYLGVIERVLKADQSLGGLAFQIDVTGDMVDVDSPYGAQADGALYCSVRWSQQEADPRKGRSG